MCNTNDTPSDEILCPCCGVGEIVMGDCSSCNVTLCYECEEYPVCGESDRLCAGCLDDAEQGSCTDAEFEAEMDSARDADRNGSERPSAEECGA